MAGRSIVALALLAGTLSAGAPASAAENACKGRAAEIVGKAYPGAKQAADGRFAFGDRSITLLADDRRDYETNSMVCRQWPARPDLFLVAVPLMKKIPAEGAQEGDLDILVLDTETLDVRHRLTLDGAMFADGVRIRDVAFDTALYQLSPDNLAFGLRVAETNGSRANPFDAVTLRLFSIEADRLRPIVDKLVVTEHRGEWDTNCNGEFTNTKRILSMAKSATGGPADIVIAETRVTTVDTEIGDECESADRETKAGYRLRFKDGAYAVPDELRGWRE